jgi:dethiobiotin synthetase
MKQYFITATGTDIGKTLVTSAMTHQLRAAGKKVRAIKPVISGYDESNVAGSDTGELLRAQNLPFSPENIEKTSPWRFAAALSPDMAAEAEGAEVDFDALIYFCKMQDTDHLLIEGAGGVMTPLTKQHTMLDWMEALGAPVILVAGTYLGTLSHTLSAAHAILGRGLPFKDIILNTSPTSSASPSELGVTLRRLLPKTIMLHDIRRLDSSPDLWKYVPNLLPLLS